MLPSHWSFEYQVRHGLDSYKKEKWKKKKENPNGMI